MCHTQVQEINVYSTIVPLVFVSSARLDTTLLKISTLGEVLAIMTSTKTPVRLVCLSVSLVCPLRLARNANRDMLSSSVKPFNQVVSPVKTHNV